MPPSLRSQIARASDWPSENPKLSILSIAKYVGAIEPGVKPKNYFSFDLCRFLSGFDLDQTMAMGRNSAREPNLFHRDRCSDLTPVKARQPVTGVNDSFMTGRCCLPTFPLGSCAAHR